LTTRGTVTTTSVPATLTARAKAKVALTPRNPTATLTTSTN